MKEASTLRYKSEKKQQIIEGMSLGDISEAGGTKPIKEENYRTC